MHHTGSPNPTSYQQSPYSLFSHNEHQPQYQPQFPHPHIQLIPRPQPDYPQQQFQNEDEILTTEEQLADILAKYVQDQNKMQNYYQHENYQNEQYQQQYPKHHHQLNIQNQFQTPLPNYIPQHDRMFVFIRHATSKYLIFYLYFFYLFLFLLYPVFLFSFSTPLSLLSSPFLMKLLFT